MSLNPRNVAIIVGLSALTSGAIVFAVNNRLAGLDKLLGNSSWF
ncbi:TPA: hypothetical protein ACGUVV_004887 [Vibrio vulnificus]